jgi:RNA polymerase sigma factor (sigma-70 family)
VTPKEEPSMPPRDPKDPRTLTTVGGVKVIVHPQPPPPPPEPRREPEPVERGPRVIIVPEGLSDKEMRAWLDVLARENQQLVEDLLARRRDVLEESRQDLRNRVLVILCEHVKKTKQVPEDMKAWLHGVIRKQVRNHKDKMDKWRTRGEEGVDVEALPAGSEDEPEGAADRAGRSAKLSRCLPYLPADQAAVIRCVRLFEMTLEETAGVMGKPLSNVHRLAKLAVEELEILMRTLPDDGEENEGT